MVWKRKVLSCIASLYLLCKNLNVIGKVSSAKWIKVSDGLNENGHRGSSLIMINLLN